MDILKLLLIGGAQVEKRQKYYEYCQDFLNGYLRTNLPSNPKVMLIPWAIWGNYDADKMFKFSQEHWAPFGLELTPFHLQKDYFQALGEADMIIVSGGSIHSLVDNLEKNHLMEPLRERIHQGCVYVGTSSGSVIAGPTMHTATEPPLIHVMSHKTLDIVPFQINVHYYDIGPDEFHHGPPPDVRIKNYLQINPHPAPVVCLRDGSLLEIAGDKCIVRGIQPATVFTKRLKRIEFEPDSEIPLLLNYRSRYYKEK
jgi:dipeptidase E